MPKSALPSIVATQHPILSYLIHPPPARLILIGQPRQPRHELSFVKRLCIIYFNRDIVMKSSKDWVKLLKSKTIKAVGDLDLEGRRSMLNNSAIQFQSVTASSDINDLVDSWRTAGGDVNSDGLSDLWLHHQRPNERKLYINQGSRGNDRVVGGNGFDILNGGGGCDDFVFQNMRHGADQSVDLNMAQDQILIRKAGFDH